MTYIIKSIIPVVSQRPIIVLQLPLQHSPSKQGAGRLDDICPPERVGVGGVAHHPYPCVVLRASSVSNRITLVDSIDPGLGAAGDARLCGGRRLLRRAAISKHQTFPSPLNQPRRRHPFTQAAAPSCSHWRSRRCSCWRRPGAGTRSCCPSAQRRRARRAAGEVSRVIEVVSAPALTTGTGVHR